MSWMDRLEEYFSEKAPSTEVPEVPKAPFVTFDTPYPGPFQKNNSESARRYAYRFRLHNNEGGGVVLTDEPTLDKARDSLAKRYGDRLALVVKA